MNYPLPAPSAIHTLEELLFQICDHKEKLVDDNFEVLHAILDAATKEILIQTEHCFEQVKRAA